MHPNKTETVNRGWESMHKILDKEMPLKKDKRRLFLYWLTGGLAIIMLTGVLAYTIFQPQVLPTSSGNSASVTETSNLPNDNITTKIASEAESKSKSKSQPEEPELGSDQLVATHQGSKPTVTLSEQKRNPEPTSTTTTSSSDLSSATTAPSVQETHQQSPRNRDQESIHSKPLEATQTSPQAIDPTQIDQNPSLTNSSLATNEQTNPTTLTNNKEAIIPTEIHQPINQTTQPSLAIETQHPPTSNTSSSQQESNVLKPITASDLSSNQIEETPADIATVSNKSAPQVKQTNTIAVSRLIAKPISLLMVPETSTLEMYLPLAPMQAVVIKPAYTLSHQWEITVNGLYANQAKAIGFESSLGWRTELSKAVSAHIAIGGGCLDISNPASLGELSDLSRFNAPEGIETGMDTADPIGPAGPAEAGAGNDTGGIEGDTEIDSSPEIPDLELTTSQLRSLSRSNLSSLKYLMSTVGVRLSPSRRIHIGAQFGIDYIVHSNFNRIFLEDDKFLTTEAASNVSLSDIQLETGRKILPFAEANTTVKLSQNIGISAGYKYYLKALYPAIGKSWLNQFKLGVVFSLSQNK